MIAISRDEEQLKLPLDRRGFLRRECGTCHRQFKLRWCENDAGQALQSLGSLLPHINQEELIAATSPRRHCPYCASLADDEGWWTEEQRLFLTKRANSLREEIRFEQLRMIERTLGQNPYLTFLPVAPAPFRLAVRPDPDDMRVVPLVCCGEDVKVRDSWSGLIHCPYCGAQHEIQPQGSSK